MNTQEKATARKQIELFLAEQYEGEPEVRYSVISEPLAEPAHGADSSAVRAVQEYMREQADEETFSEQLLRIIRERDLKDSDVYNGVFMDRSLFSKLRNNPGYRPSKRTAILLVLALRLPLPDAQELLGKAGYQLSHSDKGDLIVEYFISRGNYNVLEVDEMLAEFGEPLLLKDR